MTVKELHKELSDLIDEGHGNTRVIARCLFSIDGEGHDYALCHLNDVYYQSDDIELEFSDKDDEEWPDVVKETDLS